MSKPTITEFENLILDARQQYYSCLNDTLNLAKEKPSKDQILNQISILHNKGVTFFNLFERSIDEYGLSYFKLNLDTRNRKIEDARNLVEVIVNHWKTLKLLSNEYSVICPTVTPTAYSSIQRLLKYFQSDQINVIKEKFMNENLPTNGFDSPEIHSGWKIGSKKLTRTQIIFGLLFIIASAFIAFYYDTLNGFQYLLFRLILTLGITLISTALIEINVKINWTIEKSFAIKAIGAIAFFIIIYYINPPAVPIP